MKHKVLLTLILIFAITYTNAQNVGIGTSNPNALLDVYATNGGVLIPRVALTDTGSASPLTSPAVSTMIYNTAKVTNVTPGYYYWSGTAWIRLIDNASIGGATTVSNTSSANTLSTTVNGVTGATVPIVNSISNTSSVNTLSTTVNGVTGTGVNIINSTALGLTGNNLTATINGIGSSAQSLSGLSISGDVTGTLASSTVVKIQGQPVSATTPTGGQVLEYNSGTWTPTPMSGDVTISSTGVTAIGANKVSYADIQKETNGTILGNNSGALASPSEITLGSGLSFSGATLNTVNNGTVTSVTASNGLTSSGGNTPNITLGGTLTGATTIAQAGNNVGFTGTGSVGVGNNSPNFKLDVQQDITMNTDLTPGTAQLAVAGATAPGKRMILGYDVNGNGFGFIKAGYYQNAWTTLSLQPNGGTVGIGTTSPAATLDISTGNLRVGSLTASSAVYTDASKILTSTAPTAGTIGYWQRNGTTLAPATITDGVGIGATTINASNKLDVIGGGLLIGASDVHADASLFITSSYGGFDRLTQIVPSVASKPALNIMASTDGTNTGQWWAWGVNSNIWSIQPGTSFTGSTGLFINTSGNVGIGTTTPGGKLDVVGGALRLSNAYLDVNRTGYVANGISWYAQSFPAWSTYMSPGGQTATGPHGDLTAPLGTYVTSWALRNYIENSAGYGWTFESAANTTTPSVKFEIRSIDGLFHSTGNGIVDGNVNAGGVVTAGASAIMGTGIAGGYYQDATNGAYRSIVSSATTNGYYFETNGGATIAMYVGLGGAYNGNVGIGTWTPSQSLEIMGNTLCHGIHYQKTSDGQGSGAHGISWYDPSYTTWFDYMAPVGGTNAPSGTAAPSDATSGVTSWARRFNIESVAGYGWIFESGVQGAGNAPTAKFSINSSNGNIHATGSVYAGASAVMGTGIAGGYYQDAGNGAYRAIVASTTTTGYYFQTNGGTTTTMYVGLGGAYNGSVGIGTLSPAYTLDVTGSIRCTGSYVASDRRYKQNISNLQNSLAKIEQLQGVSYDWRKDEFPDMHFNDLRQIGLIAQEVEKIMPDAVSIDNKGYYSINYPALVPVLIEAIKELEKKIEYVQTQNEQLKNDNASFKTTCTEVQHDNSVLNEKVNALSSTTTDIQSLQKQMDTLKTLIEKNGIRGEK